MNYKKNYNDYINYVKSLDRRKDGNVYYEKHHVCPRCLGGNDDSGNLVLLTVREHFLAHYLLMKIYKDDKEFYQLVKAFTCMTRINASHLRYVNSKLYDCGKKLWSSYMKDNNPMKDLAIAKKVSLSKKGRSIYDGLTQEECCVLHEHLSESHKGITVGKLNGAYGKGGFYNKTKEEMLVISKNISDGRNNMSKEAKDSFSRKLSDAHLGVNTWEKLSEAEKLVAKEKLSIATTGDKNPRSRHIFCKELNIYFGTMQEASKILNLSLDKIRKMLNNGNSYNEKTLVEITKDEFFNKV